MSTTQPVTAGDRHPPEEVLLGFARALRAAGVHVTADRERTYLEAVAALGLGSAAGAYHAGRATLCTSPADLERHDLVFAEWFGGTRAGWARRDPPPRVSAQAPLASSGSVDGGPPESEDVRARASGTEVLRRRDVATLSRDEREELARLFARLRPRAPRRRAHRWQVAARGGVDARRTLRATLRRMGEPGEVAWRRRGSRARRVVLLVDVSGSMSAYADALVRLAHAYCTAGVPTEVFTLGTRLTHITRPLHVRDPDRAIVAAGEAIPDWSGGTRLAEGVKVFLDRWGRRGMARGAVVVVFSDGWERDDPQALGEQVRRLAAVAHRVVWVNPHRGKAGYAPVQGGIMAVLPHVDALVAGHSMAAFEELTEVVAHA
ncbi:VWA domain-containing protein [Phycicoccus endophyticus]|uniref:VWA domain-containing protein n=1 Tax=Phycicoccus endophyticus TaxID=1690220 RepID=A0A7G9QZB1_9MICO|nr:VWA domain-containing protein [Phycicoccus endophyticus]NHI19040.1 VWA domain-containing protein [Phycicoccus endophyticus]QNN48686.1 VWA domain-containing protein [Phycicoccus endophyticus]GGL32396.1 VWA domain-containing protein [Phycicoccus endophyticus]